MRFVDQNVTLHGRIDFNGHVAPYLQTYDEPVYLITNGSAAWKPESKELQGKTVSITGILRFHKATAENQFWDRYFYFDAETAKIRH